MSQRAAIDRQLPSAQATPTKRSLNERVERIRYDSVS
jgi:hypothetical protein